MAARGAAVPRWVHLAHVDPPARVCLARIAERLDADRLEAKRLVFEDARYRRRGLNPVESDPLDLVQER